jgi:hypothetical protein
MQIWSYSRLPVDLFTLNFMGVKPFEVERWDNATEKMQPWTFDDGDPRKSDKTDEQQLIGITERAESATYDAPFELRRGENPKSILEQIKTQLADVEIFSHQEHAGKGISDYGENLIKNTFLTGGEINRLKELSEGPRKKECVYKGKK